MKIDLHCHTLKTKQGDPKTRNVDKDKFICTLDKNDVSIVAITNHNYFDRVQYESFKNNDSSIIVWPGIELDVIGLETNTHVIVVCNPSQIEQFVNITESYIKEKANDFKISLETFADSFIDLDCVVLAHYGSKSPQIDEQSIDFLKDKFDDKIPLYMEVTDIRSAGIMQAHGINSVLGSDVQDWDKYPSHKIPVLKNKIKDFDSFKRLISKDSDFIKTFIEPNLHENIEIEAFPMDGKKLTFPIYKDMNVFFGGKGTGKSVILESLNNYFVGKSGLENVSYFRSEDSENIFKSKVKEVEDSQDWQKLNSDGYESSFTNIKNWKEPTLTAMSKYKEWQSTKDSSMHAKSFGFTTSTFHGNLSNSKLVELLNQDLTLRDYTQWLKDYSVSMKLLTSDENEALRNLYDKLIFNHFKVVKNSWIEINSMKLEEFTINRMKSLCSKKSGAISKPSSIGLLDMARSLSKLQVSIENIIKVTEMDSVSYNTKIGELEEKGTIFAKKTITANPNYFGYKFPNGLKKTKNLMVSMKNTLDCLFTDLLEEKMSELINLIHPYYSVYECMGSKVEIVNEKSETYKPSKGEMAMLAISNSLIDDNKEIFILDEPELSVGHSYINRVILPRLIELARARKVVIVATHDANVAVRTLPYTSVYRDYINGEHRTFIGSALEKYLHHTESDLKIDWVETSLEALEGGKFAFGERGDIYGI